MSAYQIRYDIVQNVRDLPADKFHVNPNFKEPFINFAFFQPRCDSLNLSDLIFFDISRLKEKLKEKVKEALRPKIKVRADYNFQLLPESVIPLLGRAITEPPLNKEMDELAKESNLIERKRQEQKKVLSIVERLLALGFDQSALAEIRCKIDESLKRNTQLQNQVNKEERELKVFIEAD